jgi:sulfate/thiosulfate transport system substrate-binding protein
LPIKSVEKEGYTLPRRQTILFSLVALLASFAAVACGSSSSSGGDSQKLTLVAYSTPREAYEEIIPAFQKTAAGQGVDFDQSYAASGEQSRSVEAGLPADFVAFSLEPDVTRLVDAKLVASDWADDAYKGMVTDSVVVFAVRPGNPEGIQTWDDLLKEGIEVVTPNPFTSGGAQWNIMAGYGAQLEQGKTKDEGIDYLRELFLHHVPVQDTSAREALQTFIAGKGDVLLAYENEAIFAKNAGQALDYVVPDETILIENPVAMVNTTKDPTAVQAFIDFLRSDEAQKIFGENGYRPVNEDVAGQFDFPEPSGLFTIADLGGWPDIRSEFFDREAGIFADIENELGVPTDG